MDVPLGDTYYRKFTTRQFSTGAPFTLAGTPVISVYEENNATQITAGITLTVDYDTVTGLNDVAIVATSGNGYEAGKYYSVVITTGTVDSVSVVGEVVGQFRIVAAENTAGTRVVEAGTVGDKTGYSLTQSFPTNFANLSITASTGRVDVAAIQGVSQTGHNVGSSVNTLNTDWADGGRLDVILDGKATPAQVNTEVSDVIKTDTFTQPSQGEPPANPTLAQAVMYGYTELRNKVVVDTATANQKQVFADNGTTILYEKNLTNAGNITTIDKAQTGA